EEERANSRLVVEVKFDGWPNTPEKRPVDVVACRRSDGWTTSEDVGEQGVALLDVRPGDYDVEVVGRRLGGGVAFARGATHARVPPDGGGYARVSLKSPARIRLRPGGSPDLRVDLLTDGSSEALLPRE